MSVLNPSGDRSDWSSFGREVDLGGEVCQTKLAYFFYPQTVAQRGYSCTAEEAEAIRKLKGKSVTFRATIIEATIDDTPSTTKNYDEQGPNRLCIRLKITRPSLNGMLPAHYAGR